MKRVLLIFVALLMVSSAALADAADAAAKPLSVRTFTFKYKDAQKAAAMIKSLVSAEGLMSIQPSTNALVVTDRPENLKTITKALTEFDTPPQTFRLTVRLVGASRVEGPPPKISDDLKDVAPKLAMLRFNAFENLGNADVVGKESDRFQLTGSWEISAYAVAPSEPRATAASVRTSSAWASRPWWRISS